MAYIVMFGFILELFIFLLAIGVGAFLLSQTSSSCAGFRFLGITLILIGVVLMICMYIGCSCLANGDDANLEDAKYKFLLFSVPLILALLALGIFAMAASSRRGGKSLPGRSYKVYHLESYPKWMRNKVNNSHNWDIYYKKAVVKGHVCRMFLREYQLDILDEFHKRSLSPFEVVANPRKIVISITQAQHFG